MLVVIDFMLRNVKYVSDVGPGTVIVCGSSAVDDEFLLSSLTNIPTEEEIGLIDGYYPLEKVLFEDEGIMLEDEVVVNRNGVILYERDVENVKLLSMSEFLRRLKPDLREDLPDVSELGLELQSAKIKKAKQVLVGVLAFVGLWFMLNLFLSSEGKRIDKRVEELVIRVDELKREKQALKDRYWAKVGGVSSHDIRDLLNRASFIDFMLNTFKVEVDSRGVRIEGLIYPEQLMYVSQECKRRHLVCNIEYKQIRAGEDAYVVSVSRR